MDADLATTTFGPVEAYSLKPAGLQSQQFQNVPDAPPVVAGRPPNPKQAFGNKKPPIAYFPLSAILAGLEALFDGALKYDPHNWRDDPVEAMTYVHAAERHLKLFSVGKIVRAIRRSTTLAR
ncbi:dATP/dGTP diphosphohydrolase domain-containing protein [Mesorhizobium sp. dw_380]|uniref:dATP/dGTP diphosphohydrolase domain-containing protein n=1 Tax=Mesorhizobium sp. dw_380 TaxID=2812001 RepID=UPI001BDE1480|nr:dATP/dGTP diphosphohydrolase domain-containing protein [Mesorhizobium sp. dw_380]